MFWRILGCIAAVTATVIFAALIACVVCVPHNEFASRLTLPCISM